MTINLAPILEHQNLCVCPCCATFTTTLEMDAGSILPATGTSKPLLEKASVSDQLTKSWSTAGYDLAWDQDVVTYSLSYLPAAELGPEHSGWTAMTEVMQEAARESLELWDDVIAISIVEAPNDENADISLNYSSTTNGGTYAIPNGTFNGIRAEVSLTDADIWFADNWSTHNDDSDFYTGGYGLLTYNHEIGHALGLSHPGHYNGYATFASDAAYYQDTLQYSVMSYFEAGANGEDVNHTPSGNYWPSYAASPLLHDILALQSLYGADMSTRVGATTYGFNSNAERDVFDFTQNVNPVVAIWDAGGIDTIDVSGWNTDQVIELTAGSFSSVGSLTKNLAIAYGAVIENAVGGGGDDLLIGNRVANRLTGGSGEDTLSGRAGNDTILGGDGADTVKGGNGNDTAKGGAGVDKIFGETGDDDLRGGNHNDNIFGGGGIDILRGDAGDDVLNGGGGGDELIGGNGNDTATGGSGIDAIFGQDGNDDLRGGTGADKIFGGRGNDFIRGDAGNDTLVGGAGSDDLIGGAGDDIFTGGAAADTFVFQRNSGDDTITDFEHNLDQIELRGTDQNFTSLTIADINGSAEIDYGTGRIVVEGASATSLSSEDFLFT